MNTAPRAKNTINLKKAVIQLSTDYNVINQYSHELAIMVEHDIFDNMDDDIVLVEYQQYRLKFPSQMHGKSFVTYEDNEI